MTKIQKLQRAVNAAFTGQLQIAFSHKFNRSIDSTYSIVAMRVISYPSDGKPFTSTQKAWIQAYEKGYSDAHELIIV